MTSFFYSSSNEPGTNGQDENAGNQEPKLQSELLSTGNQVIQSPSLTEKINGWRNSVIHQYNGIAAEWSNLKSATRNEIDSGKDYLNQNVFNDPYETEKLLLPSTILSLGAFFCGRVLSNKNNWGHKSALNRNASVLGRVLTSLPSRFILPFALSGLVFDQLTPVTTRHALRTVERDLLPETFVQESHRIWDQLYVQGVKQGSGRLGGTIEDGLQNGIKGIRESIGGINGDTKQ